MSITRKAEVLWDVVRLARADKAVAETTPKMRRATLEYLWDKWVRCAKPEKHDDRPRT